jgi:hypothetical protein
MNIDKKIIEELRRYNYINNYINEQEAGTPPADEPALGGPLGDLGGGDLGGGDLGGGDLGGGVPPADPAAPPAPDAGATGATESSGTTTVDIANDPDVEEVGKEGDETEELDITDLVNSQKNIEDKQEEYFNNLFKQLGELEKKVGEMDNLVNTINNLEAKIEKLRPKTPEEKLELRSLDSGPFKQKLSDFFVDKKEEMEKSGKNEYVLTSDEVEDYSPGEIEDSFYDYGDDQEDYPGQFSRR